MVQFIASTHEGQPIVEAVLPDGKRRVGTFDDERDARFVAYLYNGRVESLRSNAERDHNLRRDWRW